MRRTTAKGAPTIQGRIANSPDDDDHGGDGDNDELANVAASLQIHGDSDDGNRTGITPLTMMTVPTVATTTVMQKRILTMATMLAVAMVKAAGAAILRPGGISTVVVAALGAYTRVWGECLG